MQSRSSCSLVEMHERTGHPQQPMGTAWNRSSGAVMEEHAGQQWMVMTEGAGPEPLRSPCGISLGKTASHVKDLMRRRDGEW